MAERVTWVDYAWKDNVVDGDTMAQVVILNDPDLYEKMSEDEDFDQRIWYYFQDEAEFQRAFDPKNEEHDFYLLAEHPEYEGIEFE
jgi:hypothetical protein